MVAEKLKEDESPDVNEDVKEGDWRWIKPNRLQGLYEKYAEGYIREQFEIHGIRRKPQYRVFADIVKKYLTLLLTDIVLLGKDKKVAAGELLCRQVKAPAFRNSRFSRKFDLDGGREYDIFDLLKRNCMYPVFTFRNKGGVVFKTVMWMVYVRLRLKWRHELYKNFYDRRFEYKEMRVFSKPERKTRVIWRNNVKIKVKK